MTTKAANSSGKDSAGMIYALGLIGAVVYFIQHAQGFTGILLAIVKAIIWPALLVHGLLGFIRL